MFWNWILNKQVLALLALIFLVLFNNLAIASSLGGGGLPYEDSFDRLFHLITGPIPFSIAIVGLVIFWALIIFGHEISGAVRSLLFVIFGLCALMAVGNIVAPLVR